MVEGNPWKTPFGRLLIGSSIVAAVVGFSLAAGVATYFKTEASAPEALVDDVDSESEVASGWSQLEAPQSSRRDVITDPEGYAEALAGLGQAPDAQATGSGESVELSDEGAAQESVTFIEGFSAESPDEAQTSVEDLSE